MKKNSFILYSDYLKYFNKLEMLEKGKLIDALLKYGQGISVEEEIKTMESATEMAFMFISNQIDIDAEKYDKRCETSRTNGLMGGRPPKKASEDEEPNANLKEPNETQNEPIEEEPKKVKKKKQSSVIVLSDDDIESLIAQNFKDGEVAELFKSFVLMRKAKGQSKAVRTKATFDGLVKKLRDYAKTKEDALTIIQNAIDNCWQSFFPLPKTQVQQQEDAIPYAN